MSTLLITYNLNGHDDDYEKLFKLIKELGDSWHDASRLDSVWFVKTSKTPVEARMHIRDAFDRDDNCFVVDITGMSRRGWMPQAFWDWLDG